MEEVALQNLTQAVLDGVTQLYAEAPDGCVLVWSKAPMPSFQAPSRATPTTPNTKAVKVNSLRRDDLAPVFDRLKEIDPDGEKTKWWFPDEGKLSQL